MPCELSQCMAHLLSSPYWNWEFGPVLNPCYHIETNSISSLTHTLVPASGALRRGEMRNHTKQSPNSSLQQCCRWMHQIHPYKCWLSVTFRIWNANFCFLCALRSNGLTQSQPFNSFFEHMLYATFSCRWLKCFWFDWQIFFICESPRRYNVFPRSSNTKCQVRDNTAITNSAQMPRTYSRWSREWFEWILCYAMVNHVGYSLFSLLPYCCSV